MTTSKPPYGHNTPDAWAGATDPEEQEPVTAAAQGVRERALQALRAGHFDLIEQVLEDGDLSVTTLVENLRVYQAELEIQNEELRASEQHALTALARYTKLFTELPMAVLMADDYGLILEANPSARSLLALRDIRSHQYFLVRLVHEDDRAAVADAFQRAKRSRADALSELRFAAADGSRFQADLHVGLLPAESDSQPRRFICAVVDQTEVIRQRDALARAYDRLERSEERYRVVADHSPDWDYWYGPDRRFLYVSPACAEVTGYTAEEFREDSDLFERIVHPDDLPQWQGHLADADDFEHHDQERRVFRIRARDGRVRWIEHVCRPVSAPDGRFLGRRGVNRDITERQEARAALARSEARFRAVFDAAPVGIAVVDADERVVMTNAALQRFLGYAEAELRRMSLRDCTHTDEVAWDNQLSADLLAGRRSSNTRDMRFVRKDGRIVWGQLTMAPLRTPDAEDHCAIAMIADIDEGRAAALREAQAHRVFENTSEGIVITDAERRIIAVNPAFTEITGYTEQEALGQNPRMLQSGRHDASFYQAMWASLERTGQWRGQFWNRRKNGECYPQLSTISVVRDPKGDITNYIGVFGDITQLKRSEQALYELAHKDPLTGLANRTQLRARLEQSLHRAARAGRLLALLFLDLDLFKNVNDTLGHPVGDALLQSVAAAMAEQVRNSDSIARLGGDEFVVLLENIDQPETAAHLARRLLRVFAHPFAAQGRQLHITASIGISIFPEDGQDVDALLANADVAMYRAKDQGRNTYRFFTAEMSEGAEERLRLEHALRGALARKELRLEFQPQVRLADDCMHGAEVLLRWHNSEHGEIPPARFIRIAEELGLIVELGYWALEQACRQLADWDARGFLVPRLAVNLSVLQLERPELVDEVRAIMTRTRVEPDRLELEVTEAMLMRHAEQVIANLAGLRDLGLTIAVDDFGSGFSSLAYLKRLPIHRLKIDKAFIEQLTLDANDDAITRAIIALGRGLGLDVIAEGVETEPQAEFLRREGCTEAQGYLFGRPMPAERLITSAPFNRMAPPGRASS